jgi:uncharacterized protein YutE (UPF0331/DUF86 family)
MTTATLTKKQQKLYSDLIKEYNTGDWSKLCNLERFIQIKIENCMDVWHHANLTAVLEYAQNDY